MTQPLRMPALSAGSSVPSGPSVSGQWYTKSRLPMPTWFAAKPTPWATSMVSYMSAMSCCISGLEISDSSTGVVG